MIKFDSAINQKISFELPDTVRIWGLSKADHNSKITSPGGLCLRGLVFLGSPGRTWNG
jgi:hypothetical protein